jgi:ABC-type uncharacterized transport system permease subunit
MGRGDKIDWFAFWVQFSFGAILGAIVGVRFFARSEYATSSSWLPMILFLGCGGVAGGLIAGILRDDFWQSFRNTNWWRFW